MQQYTWYIYIYILYQVYIFEINFLQTYIHLVYIHAYVSRELGGWTDPELKEVMMFNCCASCVIACARRARFFVSVGTPTLIDPQTGNRAIKNNDHY